MPRKVWEAWRRAFNPDIDAYSDAASGGTCAPSGFAPADIGAQNWTTFTLTGPEIQTLKAAASSDLQAIFGQTGMSTITSLSFEFRSAAVVRPWFNSAIFDARFWKFADGSPDLSGGEAPPRGAWPALVTAVVFARNIRVTIAAALPQPLQMLPAIAVDRLALPMLQAQRAATIAMPPVLAATPVAVARPAMAARPFAAATAAPVSTVALAAMRPAMASGAFTAVRPIAAPVNAALRLNAAMIYRGPLPVSPPAPTPAPRPLEPPPQPQPPDNTISILAFICRPLGKAPNPDPALDWSDSQPPN